MHPRLLAGLSLLVLCVVLLSGCVEHQGYGAGLDALKANDITKCNALKEQGQIRECYYTYADGKNDPKECLKAPDPAACVNDYASKRQLIGACDVLTDAIQKYACIARVAGDHTGRSAEEIIADFRSQGASKKCLAKCDADESKCKLPCDLNKTYMPEYEKDGMIIVPVDTVYIDCVNKCKGGYIVCRDDCLRPPEE